MAGKLYVKIPAEDAHFAKEDADRILKLREEAKKKSDTDYRESHKYHCFRCGTASLVEIQKGKTVVDVCVNDGCGAIHLDGGELDQIVKDEAFIKSSCRKILGLF